MRNLMIVFALLLTGNAYSQVNAEWKTPVDGTPKSIYFHSFTQTPIVETSSNYYGVNSNDKLVVWTIKKSATMAALQAARTISALTGSSDVTAGIDMEQYYEIPNTQFASINSNIIDVSTGKTLLGEGNNPFKSLIADNIVAELNILLLKVKDEDGSEKLYGIDIATSTVIWSTKLADANAAKAAMKFIAKANGLDQLKIDLFKPSITASKDIIYNNNGKLSLINSKTGAILWENDCNPGTFSISPDQSKIIVVDRPTGLSSISGTKPFGKKVIAIDAVTGKDLWSEPVKLDETYKMLEFLDNNQVLLAYKNGLNLFDLATGKNLWKKDFEANNLKSMETTTEGLELQYGNKIMAIDTKTGKKLWKKAVELEGIDENAEFEPFKKEYKNTRVVLSPTDIYVYDKASGDKKWSRSFDEEAKVGFDDANNKILIISKKRVYLFSPDAQAKAPKAIEIKIENPKEIVGFDIKTTGYFIYGQKEFILISKEGNLIMQKEYKQLKGNRLANAALLTASIASGVAGTHGTVSVDGGPAQEVGAFVDPATAKAFEAASQAQSDLRNSLKANDKQRRAVKTDNTYGYFNKGESVNGTNVISMVLVDKKTGKEAKTFDFSSDRDVVFEIDFNNGNLFFIDKGQFNSLKL
ncbi:MAG: PQQ-binding-like beta-propeller repeat protein [Tenuifilaceae bacterium]